MSFGLLSKLDRNIYRSNYNYYSKWKPNPYKEIQSACSEKWQIIDTQQNLVYNSADSTINTM